MGSHPRPIEQFQVGDAILSRSENMPGGPLETKVVEEVFRGTGAIFHLHVAGQVIRTTGEHPFFAYNKGWVNANELAIGDYILGEGDNWLAVEGVYETGEWEAVYNLRIADWHTYFVTGHGWGFCVWSHNACIILRRYAYAGVTWQAKHWSVEIVTDNRRALHIHQENDRNPRPPRRNADLSDWMDWHPTAWVERIAPGVAAPNEVVEKVRSRQIDNLLAIAAKQVAGNLIGNARTPYNLVTNSCFTILVPVLRAAGFPLTDSVNEATMNMLLGELNLLVE